MGLKNRRNAAHSRAKKTPPQRAGLKVRLLELVSSSRAYKGATHKKDSVMQLPYAYLCVLTGKVQMTLSVLTGLAPKHG